MIPINHVMIEVPKGDTKINIGGVDMSINISFNPHDHVVTNGIIKGIPEYIFKNKYADGSLNPRGMEWETEIDIQVGDVVYFQKIEAIHALGNIADPIRPSYEDRSSYIVEDDKLFIFIPYYALFSVNRNGKIIMLNGYTVVQPIKDEKEHLFYVPEAYQKDKLSVGRVLLTGKPNTAYYGWNYIDSEDFQEGDKVLFYKYNNVPHKDMMDMSVFKIQRRYIISKFKF